MPRVGISLNDFNTGLAQLIDITLGRQAVGNNPVNRRWRCDQRETATAEFARIANGYDDSGYIHHGAIYFCLQEIRRAQAAVVVVPESRTTTCPSSTIRAAAVGTELLCTDVVSL